MNRHQRAEHHQTHESKEQALDLKVPGFEPPRELRELAGRTVEQGRKLCNDYFATARKAATGSNGAQFPSGIDARDFVSKCLDYAERNTNAVFDHADRLVRAENFQQAMEIQAEFVKAQFMAVQQQWQEIGAEAQRAAREVGASKAHKGP
jgi:phasin